MKRFFTPFRLATYFLLLLFLGHTAGGMLGSTDFGAGSDTVVLLMKNVHFSLGGNDTTWYNLWFGFGIILSGYLLLSAVMAWQLDGIEKQNWRSVRWMAWALVAASGWNAVLSWKYFFAGPGALATIITVLLAIGAWRKGLDVATRDTPP